MTSFDDDRAYDYFRSISWCATYLSKASYIRAKGIGPRTPPETTTFHTLFTKTFNTPTTIPAVLSLYKLPPDGEPITEAVAFISLGSDVNGHVDTAHGGTVATILDECAGLIQRVGQSVGGDSRFPIFTAYLHVKYVRPVKTPQVVVVDARTLIVKGRKKKVYVKMKDQTGLVLAEAEALFVRGRGEARL